jgi:acyl-CoA thioester hydrolase
VTYRIGLFRRTEEGDDLAAVGRFVHVYVDRETRRPVSIPDNIRNALRPLQDN